MSKKLLHALDQLELSGQLKMKRTSNTGQNATKQNIAQGFGGRSKETDSVATPKDLYDALHAEFDFKLDPCPIDWDASKHDSGLEIPWARNGWTYVNPPYSCVELWFEKAVIEMGRGSPSVFLVPYRGSNSYWKKFVWGFAAEVRHFTTKIKFPGFNKQAPMSLCLVVFCLNYRRIETTVFERIGSYEFMSHPVSRFPVVSIEEQSREYAKRLLECNKATADIHLEQKQAKKAKLKK